MCVAFLHFKHDFSLERCTFATPRAKPLSCLCAPFKLLHLGPTPNKSRTDPQHPPQVQQSTTPTRHTPPKITKPHFMYYTNPHQPTNTYTKPAMTQKGGICIFVPRVRLFLASKHNQPKISREDKIDDTTFFLPFCTHDTYAKIQKSIFSTTDTTFLCQMSLFVVSKTLTCK